MTRPILSAALVSGLTVAAGYAMLSAQSATMSAPSATAEWATHAQNEYQVLPNVTYLTANGFEAKLDCTVAATCRRRSRRWSSTTAAAGSAARRKPRSCR